jgi:hypothetical protein
VVQGVGGRKNDGKGNPASKACWIAEALYGTDVPRTLIVRAFLSEALEQRRPGWPFIAAYTKVGRQVASLIRSGHLPERVFRPLFDRLVARAANDFVRRSTRRF